MQYNYIYTLYSNDLTHFPGNCNTNCCNKIFKYSKRIYKCGQ